MTVVDANSIVSYEVPQNQFRWHHETPLSPPVLQQLWSVELWGDTAELEHGYPRCVKRDEWRDVPTVIGGKDVG